MDSKPYSKEMAAALVALVCMKTLKNIHALLLSIQEIVNLWTSEGKITTANEISEVKTSLETSDNKLAKV